VKYVTVVHLLNENSRRMTSAFTVDHFLHLLTSIICSLLFLVVFLLVFHDVDTVMCRLTVNRVDDIDVLSGCNALV